NADGKLDLNSRDHNGATLLHIAAANGYNSVIEFLLFDVHKAIARGAPIIDPSLNEKDNDGWTPLHVATFWGHQRAIELFLEAGAEIDLRTKNEETVIDLCDDSDVREFIIQKSKEIETEQEQKKAAAKAAAAAAVMQSKLQLVSSSNNSLNNGSIKGNNSSSRSLKRTSTGVSRSSSVRRSSFREKEKAARKLETSFKEFIYASEAQEN
ncbi:phosphatase 1 regulatory subunit 16A-like, partial [Brachionus plicatilis]